MRLQNEFCEALFAKGRRSLPPLEKGGRGGIFIVRGCHTRHEKLVSPPQRSPLGGESEG